MIQTGLYVSRCRSSQASTEASSQVHSSRRNNICENESISFDDLTNIDRNPTGENRGIVYEGMKLAVLSAGINVPRKLVQKSLIEVSTRKARRQAFGIHASQLCTQATSDHV